MIKFVLDASVAGCWLGDEDLTPAQEELQKRAFVGEAVVPTLFRYELANVVLSKSRSIKIKDQDFILEHLSQLPINVDFEEPAYSELHRIGTSMELSAYDAAYLELASRLNLPLATYDKKLASAARRFGIEVLG